MTHIPSPLSPAALATVARLNEISGENVHKCMQCGTCSAVCPMVPSMRLTTRAAMQLLQFGEAEEVSRAEMAKLCASCHTCTVRCPRGIDVARVFEAVRLLTLRDNDDMITLREIPAETLESAPPIAFIAAFRKLTA